MKRVTGCLKGERGRGARRNSVGEGACDEKRWKVAWGTDKLHYIWCVLQTLDGKQKFYNDILRFHNWCPNVRLRATVVELYSNSLTDNQSIGHRILPTGLSTTADSGSRCNGARA